MPDLPDAGLTRVLLTRLKRPGGILPDGDAEPKPVVLLPLVDEVVPRPVVPLPLVDEVVPRPVVPLPLLDVEPKPVVPLGRTVEASARYLVCCTTGLVFGSSSIQ